MAWFKWSQRDVAGVLELLCHPHQPTDVLQDLSQLVKLIDTLDRHATVLLLLALHANESHTTATLVAMLARRRHGSGMLFWLFISFVLLIAS